MDNFYTMSLAYTRDVIIETPIHSQVKYEFDYVTNRLRVDRILDNTNVFPWNYGFVPNTMSGNNRPLGVFVLCNHALIPGSTAHARILGGIAIQDERGSSHQLVAVLVNDPDFTCYNRIQNIPPPYTQKIKYFLEHYHEGQKNNFRYVDSAFYDHTCAHEIVDRYTRGPVIDEVD